MFGREITKCTVIYGVYIRFWPTLLITPHCRHLAVRCPSPIAEPGPLIHLQTHKCDAHMQVDTHASKENPHTVTPLLGMQGNTHALQTNARTATPLWESWI